jgi:hypothetical protein
MAEAALEQRTRMQAESAHWLAMLALQSARYRTDDEYRYATDNVLAWTKQRVTDG